MRRLLLLGVCMLLILVIDIGCVPPEERSPAIELIRHDPLHPTSSQPVDYTVRATHATGVSQIVIRETVYTLGVGSTGYRTAFFESSGEVGRCDFTPASSPATCTKSGGPYANERFVRYQADITSANGRTASVEIYYSAGTYPAGWWPIPIYGNGAPAERIDVVFIPDGDSYTGNMNTFIDHLGDILDDAFLVSDPLADDVWNRFNLYYIDGTGTAGSGCSMSAPSGWSGGIGDVGAVIHTDDFRDCSVGDLFTSENYSYRTVIHELGHGAFGLADEYCCDGGYWQAAGYSPPAACGPNIYSSEASCQADTTALPGKSATDCQPLAIASTWWRSDDNPDMMRDGGGTVWPFQQCGRRRIQCVYANCSTGGC